MTDTPTYPTRDEIIATNIAMRQHSVMCYDLNIANYEMALAVLNGQAELDADDVAYKARLEELLASERRERKKEVLMLQVLEAQLPAV
jgi:uncharacterized membrane protein